MCQLQSSRIYFWSRTNFTVKLNGFGSVPCFSESLNSLKMREMAKFPLMWQILDGDTVVDTLILVETCG